MAPTPAQQARPAVTCVHKGSTASLSPPATPLSMLSPVLLATTARKVRTDKRVIVKLQPMMTVMQTNVWCFIILHYLISVIFVLVVCL